MLLPGLCCLRRHAWLLCVTATKWHKVPQPLSVINLYPLQVAMQADSCCAGCRCCWLFLWQRMWWVAALPVQLAMHRSVASVPAELSVRAICEVMSARLTAAHQVRCPHARFAKGSLSCIAVR